MCSSDLLNSNAFLAGLPPSATPDIVHHHFDVAAQAPERRLLAWREQVGHVVDVLPTRDALQQPFNASIDRFRVGPLMFTDCRSDAMRLERSLVRISRDNIRDFAFHVFLEGSVDGVAVRNGPRAQDEGGGGTGAGGGPGPARADAPPCLPHADVFRAGGHGAGGIS